MPETERPATCEAGNEVTDRDATLVLDGLRFHYREWGDPSAPPLVLLHGYTSHARSWDTFALNMARCFRVLALDQRGHGESQWAADYHELRLIADLGAFADALGLETFTAVGFSIGGFAACGYALLYPRRVERLVLAECFAEDPAEAQASTAGIEHILALRSLPDQFMGTAEEAAAQVAAAFRPLAPYAPEDELRHWMFGGLRPEADGRWIWRVDPVLRVPGSVGRLNPAAEVFYDRLASVTNPTLLVVGAESFQAESAKRMAAASPDKPLVTLARTGHWVPLDNPGGFIDIVSEYLNDGANSSS